MTLQIKMCDYYFCKIYIKLSNFSESYIHFDKKIWEGGEKNPASSGVDK